MTTIPRMDIRALTAERPLLLDGGMGSELLACGFRPGSCPESWNIERPEVISGIHRNYLAAGADIVNTNTFGGSSLKLAPFGLAERATELNEAGARLAATVRDDEFPGRFVAGSVGPCGHLLKPLGDADPGEVRDSFAQQVAALVSGGADLINIETMFDLAEVRLAVEAAVEVAGGRPVLASLAFRPSANGFHTMMGVSPERAVAELREAGAALVGCNCEVTGDVMAALVPVLAELNGGATYAQPNAGMPSLDGEDASYEQTPEEFAAIVAAYPSYGAVIVGGCCGTTPAFIAALAAALGH